MIHLALWIASALFLLWIAGAIIRAIFGTYVGYDAPVFVGGYDDGSKPFYGVDFDRDIVAEPDNQPTNG